MGIHYLVPNRDTPSWGLSMLYQHVQLLNRNGFDAVIIKELPLTSPGWLNIQVPIKSINEFKIKAKPSDILVVPEVMVNFQGLKKIKCRKIVFIQAGAYIFENLPAKEDHVSLGFEHAIVILPHLARIVEKHMKIPFTTIPAFVAPYFFTGIFSKKKKRQILLYPKLGNVDYSIVKYLLNKHLEEINSSAIKDFFTGVNWKIVELKNLTHQEVAAKMHDASFFVALNTFEALNTSVVEAMAAGCIVFCYEGFGSRDYLCDRKNAFVFQNNEAYLLTETLCQEINQYDNNFEALKVISENAVVTAKRFSKERTEDVLMKFFKSF